MSENFITIAAACKGLKDLCKSLGQGYSIREFDFEQVIYRDFGNGYEVEVCRLNTNKKKNVYGTIHIWKDGKRVIRSIMGIPREQIKDRLDEIVSLMPVFEKQYWTLQEAEMCMGCSEKKLLEIAQRRSEVVVNDCAAICFIKEELINYTSTIF